MKLITNNQDITDLQNGLVIRADSVDGGTQFKVFHNGVLLDTIFDTVVIKETPKIDAAREAKVAEISKNAHNVFR